RHTRFSRDWSSDVCSSDLDAFAGLPPPVAAPAEVLQLRDRDQQVNQRRLARLCAREPCVTAVIQSALDRINAPAPDPDLLAQLRSEERRVGEACSARSSRD